MSKKLRRGYNMYIRRIMIYTVNIQQREREKKKRTRKKRSSDREKRDRYVQPLSLIHISEPTRPY